MNQSLALTEKYATHCYDNTKISTYKVCPRSYFIRHVLGWRRKGTSHALVFGKAWHEAQDIIWGHCKSYNAGDLAELASLAFNECWENEGLPLDIPLESESYYLPRTPSIAREMLHHYSTSRQKMLQNSEVIAIEQPFAVPVPGLQNFWYVGRLDKTISYNGQRLILEHKTTTAYATIGNFRSDWVDSWFMSAQVKGYQFGGNLFYENVDAVWVDGALVHKKIHDAFKLVPVSHNMVLLKEWLQNTVRWVEDIAKEEEAYVQTKKLTPGMFKRNEESCYGKYGACPFIDICRSVDDPSTLEEIPESFMHEVWEPFSILKLEKLVATNNGE